MLRSTCGNAPRSERSLREKQSLYDELKGDWVMHSACDLAMCLVDLNENVGMHIGVVFVKKHSPTIPNRHVFTLLLSHSCIQYFDT